MFSRHESLIQADVMANNILTVLDENIRGVTGQVTRTPNVPYTLSDHSDQTDENWTE